MYDLPHRIFLNSNCIFYAFRHVQSVAGTSKIPTAQQCSAICLTERREDEAVRRRSVMAHQSRSFFSEMPTFRPAPILGNLRRNGSRISRGASKPARICLVFQVAQIKRRISSASLASQAVERNPKTLQCVLCCRQVHSRQRERHEDEARKSTKPSELVVCCCIGNAVLL